jgi:hypothetical protein
MSSMSNPPKTKTLPFFGESEEAIRRQIEHARAFIRASEEYPAVKMLKELRRSIKRSEMEAELADGGVKTGRYREKSISQGIGAGLSSGTIVERNGKIGLPDWPEQDFK